MSVNSAKIGDKFDYLTLKEFLPREDGRKRGLFECVCGRLIKTRIATVLRKGNQPKSCGCKTVLVYKKGPSKEEAKATSNAMAGKLLGMKW